MKNSENILITKEEYYKIEINISKNRLYFTAFGKWTEIEKFLCFKAHCKEGLSYLALNFTINADLRFMPMISKELEKKFSEGQIYILKQRVLHVAEIAPINDISNLQLGQISVRSHLPVSRFATFEAAEIFLNNLSIS